MATLEIDGIGKVEVDNKFLQLTPQQQAAEVDAIAAQIKGSTPAAPPPPATAAPAQDWREAEARANLAASTPPGPQQTTQGTFGNILPLARDEKGELKFAIPAFLEGPLATARDIITGKRGLDQVSGQEGLELGALFSGLRTPAGGTGKGIAAVSEAKNFTGPVRPPANFPPPQAPAGQVQVLGVRPGAEAARETTKTALKTEAKAAYQEADTSGAVISNARMTKLRDDIHADLNAGGGRVVYDPDLHASAKVPLKRIDEAVAAGDVSYTRVDQLRKLVTTAQEGLAPTANAEMAILGKIKSKIDEMTGGLTAADVVAGDAAAVQSVNRATKLNAQAEKLNTITKMLDRATTTAGQTGRSTTLENSVINEFKALAKREGEMATFTAEEQQLIKLVARGSKGEKVARRIAAFAPNNMSNLFFSGGIGGQAGFLAGGPVGAAVGAATTLTAGLIGRRVAKSILDRNIAELETVIATGSKSASKAAAEAVKRARSAQKRLGIESGVQSDN